MDEKKVRSFVPTVKIMKTKNMNAGIENCELRVGDKVSISGMLTGTGDLEGWVDGIEEFGGQVLVSVCYDHVSREKACGRKGIVGLPVFFTKL